MPAVVYSRAVEVDMRRTIALAALVLACSDAPAPEDGSQAPDSETRRLDASPVGSLPPSEAPVGGSPAAGGHPAPSDDARAAQADVPPKDAAPASQDARPAVTPDAAAEGDGPGPVAQDAIPVADAAPKPVDAAPLPPDAPPPPPAEPIRFIAIGDTGKGNARQQLVADAMEQVCRERGPCDFALLLGDNMYDSGTDDVDDPQWQEKFETPYARLDFPFYATLGNHDYGAPDFASDFAGGLGTDPARGAAQIAYTQRSQKWRMPDSFYKFEAGPVEFVSLNTTAMFWADLPIIEQIIGFDRENMRQRATLPTWEEESRTRWRIAFAHHPFLSNGDHGNAGSYDFVFINGLIGSGTAVRDFLDEFVIGHFDLYLCGHDHNLQDLGEVRNTQLLVSGAGASTDGLNPRNEARWEDEGPGFVFLEASDQRIEWTFVRVHEEGGENAFEYAHTRSIP